MSDPDSRLTFRCSMCNFNWPFYKPFMEECRVCGEPVKALRLAAEDAESILTIDQANEILRDYGIKVVPKPGDKLYARRKPRKPTKDEVRQLYDALDAWAHTRPSWMG